MQVDEMRSKFIIGDKMRKVENYYPLVCNREIKDLKTQKLETEN